MKTTNTKHTMPFLIGLIAITALLNISTLMAQDNQGSSGTDKTPATEARVKPTQGFDEVANQALAAMKTRAEELKIKGVAVVAYFEGENVTSWSSKMVVVGTLKTASSEKDAGSNLLAIAYSKASEMADTLKASGSGVRPPMKGEFG